MWVSERGAVFFRVFSVCSVRILFTVAVKTLKPFIHLFILLFIHLVVIDLNGDPFWFCPVGLSALDVFPFYYFTVCLHLCHILRPQQNEWIIYLFIFRWAVRKMIVCKHIAINTFSFSSFLWCIKLFSSFLLDGVLEPFPSPH